MLLKNVRIEKSPTEKQKVRIIGEVEYKSEPSKTENYWFEFPEKYAEQLSLE